MVYKLKQGKLASSLQPYIDRMLKSKGKRGSSLSSLAFSLNIELFFHFNFPDSLSADFLANFIDKGIQ